MKKEYEYEGVESLKLHIEYERLFTSNLTYFLSDIQTLFNKEALHIMQKHETRYRYIGRVKIKHIKTEDSIDTILDFLPIAGYVLFNQYPLLKEISIFVAKRLKEAIEKKIYEKKPLKDSEYSAEKIISQLRKAKNIKRIKIEAGNIKIEAEMK